MENNNETKLLPLGTQVTVTDGTPRPPERFNKKLTDWRYKNYEGVIVEVREGLYTVQRKPDDGWASRVARCCVFLQSGTRPERVKPIQGAFLAPLNNADSVDLDAMIALEQAQAA